MRIFSIFLGLTFIVLFFLGIIGVGLNGAFKAGLLDINNNIPLSVALLFFISLSVLQMLFFKRTDMSYISGIIIGLGIATLLTNFTSAIGLSIIMYASGFKMQSHNKVKNENASEAGTDAQKDARPF